MRVPAVPSGQRPALPRSAGAREALRALVTHESALQAKKAALCRLRALTVTCREPFAASWPGSAGRGSCGRGPARRWTPAPGPRRPGISAAKVLLAWSHRGRLRSEAAFARLKNHASPIAYIERRICEGKTKREAIRCLKRYLARHLLSRPQGDAANRLPFIEASAGLLGKHILGRPNALLYFSEDRMFHVITMVDDVVQESYCLRLD